MANKTYPFSVAKNAHSIEFWWNRMRNILSDMECGFDSEGNDVPWDEARYDAIEKAINDPVFLSLKDKIYSAPAPVIWLTGPEIGKAKEICAWASETRAATCVANGRYDLLKYC